MKELDLHKFCTENHVEMRWDGDILSTWIYPWLIEDFAKLVESALSDGGVEARLLPDGFIWVDLVPICDYYGIDPERIFPVPERER
jgi:hypothetical protein